MELPLTEQLRQLRRSGRTEVARALVARALATRHDPALALLAWQHEAFWWQPLAGRRVRLERRGPDDLALVRRCWADAAFMQRFNRQAGPLPTHDEALRDLLRREAAAIPGESGALHWTIHAQGRTHGFVSVTEIALAAGRAEFLVGVVDGCSPWLTAEACHLVLGFLARQVRIERLTAHFYPENTAAIAAARTLGFEVEGVLRGYLRERDGRRSDLVVAGLLLDPAFFERTAGLRRRLLGPAAPSGNGPEAVAGG